MRVQKCLKFQSTFVRVYPIIVLQDGSAARCAARAKCVNGQEVISFNHLVQTTYFLQRRTCQTKARANMSDPIKIVRYETHDVRFPTSLSGDGTDAM